MKTIYIFIDDSGVFHPNDAYFVYAGYVFLSKKESEKARRKYRTLVSKLKKQLGTKGELKASLLKRKHKRALFNVMRQEESFFVAVNNRKVRKAIMTVTDSRHRYKDYMLKRIVREKLTHLIRSEQVNPYEDLTIEIAIDEQHTAMNGYYNLKSAIYEELVLGVPNFDYGKKYKPILYGKLNIDVEFCNSASNYLIQASDILANRVYTSMLKDQPELRAKPKNMALYLPKDKKK
ncbi:MAG: DUF3800 domain-containing protein [Caryophanon sp.]|nr:DUF3800 domain-containing protein [Caryophanon sp.]